MLPIEALADAIMQFEGWHRDSRSWRNRNPGNLRPTSPLQKQDGQNYRVFESLAEGFMALREDLAAKFSGSHGLTLDSTLLDLLNVYAPAGDQNNPSAYAAFVCAWCSHTLSKPVTPATTLRDFWGSPEQQA
jgi:hypothetical protein